ncbi:MAG TPA: hypothetical protein VHB53_11155, partial [Solirubrobacterales bacterium]|nr:hypothetical protein [Solirubrobacterales bacterium]
MRLGLDQLIDARLLPLVGEAREYNATTGAKESMSEPGPSTPEAMREMRAGQTERPAPHGPPPLEMLAEAAGRQVPVRILEPPG